MEIKVESEALNRIWEQLNTERRSGRADNMRTAHLDILKEGWGLSCDIQDILWETDDRADSLIRHNDDFDFLLSAYNLHFTSRYRGPFGSVKEVWGYKAMRASDIAMYVMEIERLGFSVDAEPLVTGLRPSLLRQKHLTNSELSVVWYAKQRHRCEPIIITIEGAKPNSSATIITETGYKATALLEDGKPNALRIDAPKCRKGLPLKYWVQSQMYRETVG